MLLAEREIPLDKVRNNKGTIFLFSAEMYQMISVSLQYPRSPAAEGMRHFFSHWLISRPSTIVPLYCCAAHPVALYESQNCFFFFSAKTTYCWPPFFNSTPLGRNKYKLPNIWCSAETESLMMFKHHSRPRQFNQFQCWQLLQPWMSINHFSAHIPWPK